MSDQKPGCIHPGDPEGCIGTFMFIVAGFLAGLFLSGRKR